MLTKLKALVIGYNPKDRNYSGAIRKINSVNNLIKNNKTIEAAKKLGIKDSVQKTFNKRELKQILKIMLTTGFDNNKSISKKLDWIFKRKVKVNDSIKQPKVKAIILKGIKLMEKSNDPAHDLFHVIRCLRFAEFMLNQTSLDFDWGVLVTAIVWHDVARVDNQGILYKKQFWWFRKTPIIRDLSLVGVYFRDAYESVLIVHKEFKKMGFNKKFISLVSHSIYGSDNKFLRYDKYSLKKKYQRFIADLDNLDLITIARWEDLNRNVIYKKICDKHFLNRVALLNFLFNINRIEKKLNNNIAKKIIPIIKEASLLHFKEFYKTDLKFVIKALNKTK